MKKLLTKIANAKEEIKNTKLKKEGRNDFSKYDYFTPSQIELLVSSVCITQKLLTKFDLIRNELGVFGMLTIYDCESEEFLEYFMASAIPEIKATNVAQQLGGSMTYTERYLKTSAFGITDCNLDFDSDKKTSEPVKKSEPTPSKLPEAIKEIESTLTLEECVAVWNGWNKQFKGKELEQFTKTKDKQKLKFN